MRRRFLLLAVVVAAFSLVSNAAETIVNTSEELKTAVDAAADGDVIVIGQADTELTQTALSVTKKITIKAATDLSKKPMLKLGILLKNGGSIHLDGLKFYYDADGSETNTDSKYGVQAVSEVAAIDYIRITNCEVSNLGRGLIRADHTTNIATIGEIIIDNVTVKNVSSVNSGYATIGLKTAKVSKISITNSTFVDALGGIVYSEEATIPVELLMDKVTIYNCDLKGNKDIVGFSKAIEGSKLTISNTLMYFPKTVAESDTIVKGAINLSGTATLTLTNSVILSNQFPTKINALIKPSSTHTAWTAYDVNTTVTEVVMGADFKIQMMPARITSIGDPRGHAGFTGLKELAAGSMLVYPSPATDQLMLDSEYCQVEIVNLMGMRVAGATNASKIMVNELNSGHYVVRATDAQGKQFVQKFVKK
jgi:hypothetical protein